MHHIAIMKKKWKLIEKILEGEKTIESRWYVNRFAPWNRIEAGDTVYFKNSGKDVTAKADVEKVLQFNLLTSNRHPERLSSEASAKGDVSESPILNGKDLKTQKATPLQIYKKYGKQIFPSIKNLEKAAANKENKNYCILVFLKNPTKVKQPFPINKTGYGNATAWMCVEDIESVKITQKE